MKKPGLRIVVPGVQQAVRVDLRVITMDVPSQDVISRDNVTVRVNAVLYFRVVDPEKAIIPVPIDPFLMIQNIWPSEISFMVSPQVKFRG